MEGDLKPVVEVLPEELDNERIQRLLGNQGLYDASQDEYNSPFHDDERWIVRSED